MKLRVALVAALVVAAAAGALLSTGPPRITLLNAALRVDYPWTRGLSALACAACLGLVAALPGHRLLRLAAAALALAAAGAGLHLALYRVEANTEGLATRGLLGSDSLAWGEVTSLKLQPGALLVEGAGHSLVLDTTDLEPDQRSTLERAVARRIRERAAPAPLPTQPAAKAGAQSSL